MVEFRAPSLNDDSDNDVAMQQEERNIAAMAHAFRQASDEDTRTVMNAMSNPTAETLDNLKFYAVPAPWLCQAWTLFFGPAPLHNDGNNNHQIPQQQQQPKRSVGKILNAMLIVDTGRDVSEDDGDDDVDDRKPPAVVAPVTNNDNDNNRSNHRDEGNDAPSTFHQAKANLEQFHRRRRMTTLGSGHAIKMKPGLRHGRDYFFLGANVWGLVAAKFGYDGYEICRSSCKVSTTTTTTTTGTINSDGHEEEETGTIAVALLPGEGMHAVVVGQSHSASATSTSQAETVVIPPTGRFPYEKIIPNLISNTKDVGHAAMIDDNRNTSNVVTWADDDELGESKEEEDRIILLPSSTTTPTQQHSSSPLFTERMNDMDLDSKSDRDSTSGDGVQISGRKRLASGLSNIGNTCFMNSTLQCLSNTEDLRRYFLSGDYEKDLNTDNPLGTGGELATQFARLLGEMWGIPSKRRNILGHTSYTNSYNSYPYNSAVVPREFKTCVGRHAERFMGYDQHDSQEFATYLLDALHEDTNRVTKKPYVEKPEQEEDEPDDVAAEKAWNLYLQRDDSHVLENFMGQVKSRLECCEPGCNRVSTTFDPFMYLSVPIPGSTERNLKVTFVPLDPTKRGQELHVKVSKTGKISDLVDNMNKKLCESGFQQSPVPIEDLVVTDVWNHEIFKWREMDEDVGGISDTDATIVYQLRSLEEVKEVAKETETPIEILKFEGKRTRRVAVDLPTMTSLNKNDHWMDVLTEKYCKSPRIAIRILNPHLATTEDRMEFHKRLEIFLDSCHEALEKEETGGLKRAREALDENDESENMETEESNLEETVPVVQGLVDRCDASEFFCGVESKFDFGVLEVCANKLRQVVLESLKNKIAKNNEDLVLQVSFEKGTGFGSTASVVAPLVVRVPGCTTVYEFRQMLADRLSRSLDICHSTDGLELSPQKMSSGELPAETNEMKTGEPSSEAEAAERPQNDPGTETHNLEQSALLIMRRAELKYDRTGEYRSRRNSLCTKQLGMVEKKSEVNLAMPSDEAEQTTLAVAGKYGSVTVLWDEEYFHKVFNEVEFRSVESIDGENSTKKHEKAVTVLDCIRNYCQKEQLAESDMWYCNKCKNHVRAWKQFHLHRTPPYLIIHLKRFYFASSRRRDKISEFIDFPLEGLDLSEFVGDYEESSKPIYDCYAVSNHIGGLGGGHYTAYLLSDDGSWSYYNDSSVTENYDKNDVVSPEAYVLYYRRRDVPVGQDREYRFNTNYHRPTPMICETVSPIDQRSEVSSTNTAQAGDLDETLDAASNASSGAATSPMGSVDHGHAEDDIFGEEVEDLYSDAVDKDDTYPLQ